MTELQQDNEKEVSEFMTLPTRRGHRLYTSNPSVDKKLPTRTKYQIPATVGGAIVVEPDTGVILGKGAIGFIEEMEVDSEEFIKLYLAGVNKYGELTRPGTLLFEYVYHQMIGQKGKDQDKVALNYYWAKEWKSDLSERTYHRGLSELLIKEFIFRSITTDIYFVNVRFMFNGDRMALVKSYRRKTSKSQRIQLKQA